MKEFIRKHFFLIVLLIISFITHWYIFFDFKMLNAGDWIYIPNSVQNIFLEYGLWLPYANFGSLHGVPSNLVFNWLFSILGNLFGFSYDLNTRILFLAPIVFLTPLFSLLFVKKLTKNSYIAFFSACIYSFNTFFLKLQLDWITFAFVWWIFPALFLSILEFQETNQKKYLIFNALLVFLGIAYEIRIMLLILVFSSIYVLFDLVFNYQDRKSLTRSFLILLSFVLGIICHSFWLIPMKFGGLMGDVIGRASPGVFVSFYGIIDAFTLHMYSWSNNYVLEPFIRQPIELRHFFIPLLAIFGILNLKKVFKEKNVLVHSYFFGFILVISFILAKQGFFPFPRLYQWLFSNIPLFNLYRESSKFYILIALPLSFFFGVGLSYLLDLISKINKRIGLIVVILILFFSSIFNLQHFVDQKIGAMVKGVTPHRDYETFENFLLKEDYFSRILWMPSRSRFGYYSQEHPSLSAIEVFSVFRSVDKPELFGNRIPVQNQLTSMYSEDYSKKMLDSAGVKYVVVPLPVERLKRTNINNSEKVTEIFEHYGARDYYIETLDQVSFLKKIDIGTKELAVYENEGYYPHFYTSQHQIYSTWKLDSLLKFYDLKSGLRTSLYASGKSPVTQNLNEKKEFREALEGMDEIIIETNLENLAKDEELGNYRAPITTELPFIAFKPGTFFYTLGVKKDEFDLFRLKKKPKVQFEKYLSLANKKIAEYLKFGVSDLKQFDDYKKEILGAINNLKDLKTRNDKDLVKLVVQLGATLNWQYEKLKILKLEGQAELTVEDLFRELNEEANKLKPSHEFKTLVYKFEIPKEGEYEIYQREKRVQIRDIGDEIGERRYEIEDKGRLATKSAENVQNSIYDIQKTEDENVDMGYEIEDKRNSATEEGKLKTDLSRPELLKIGNLGWKLLGKKSFREGENELTFDNPDLGENLLDDSLKIKEYFPDTVYKASFRYKASNYGSLAVNEGKEGVLFTKSLPKTGDQLQNYESYFKSSPFAEKAFLSLMVDELEGLRVEKVKQEEIILRLVADNTDNTDNTETRRTLNPTITFQFINPTKYKIKVEGAKDPYTLIFAENYHRGWKLYNADNTDSTDNTEGNTDNADRNRKLETGNKLSASGRIAETGKSGNNEIVATYFDGEVKEKKSGNGFDKNIFETWKKKPIADNRHLTANGFANSWYIKPEDVGGKENYELIIEFEPQRWLYVGLGVSLMTLFCCLAYLLRQLLITLLTLITRRKQITRIEHGEH